MKKIFVFVLINTALALLLATVEEVTQFDIHAQFDLILQNPGLFGFDDVTSYCLLPDSALNTDEAHLPIGSETQDECVNFHEKTVGK